MAYDPTGAEIEQTLHRINELLEHYDSRSYKQFQGEPLIDAYGNYVVTPVLQAKAQLLIALVAHERACNENHIAP